MHFIAFLVALNSIIVLRSKLRDQLLKCLTDRFEDDQEILKAMFIANMKPWPKNIDNEPGNQGCNMS